MEFRSPTMTCRRSRPVMPWRASVTKCNTRDFSDPNRRGRNTDDANTLDRPSPVHGTSATAARRRGGFLPPAVRPPHPLAVPGPASDTPDVALPQQQLTHTHGRLYTTTLW